MSRYKAQELFGAVLILSISLYFFIGAFQYNIGTPTRMGPGFFPMILGAAGAFYGIALIFLSDPKNNSEAAVSWRSLATVPAAILGFALSIESFGLIPASIMAVVITSLGYRDITFMNIVANAIAMSLLITLIANYLLEMPVPLFALL